MPKSKKPRGRKGGRIPLPLEKKRVLAYFYLPRWLLEDFKKLIPVAADRSNLILEWVQVYIAVRSESDRRLGQSPLAIELLRYLETTDAPKDLHDRLQSLIVQQKSDEVKVADGLVRKSKKQI